MNSLLKNSFFTLLVCFAVSANTYAAERSDGEISARSGKGAVSNDAKAGQVGVGLQVGGLTGLALQYWLSDINGINGSITSDRGNTAFSLAHIWFFPKALATLGRGSCNG